MARERVYATLDGLIIRRRGEDGTGKRTERSSSISGPSCHNGSRNAELTNARGAAEQADGDKEGRALVEMRPTGFWTVPQRTIQERTIRK